MPYHGKKKKGKKMKRGKYEKTLFKRRDCIQRWNTQDA